MRVAYMFLAMSLATAPACKKSGGAGEAIAKMTEVKDKICACKDKACVDAATAELTKWGTDHAKGDPGKVSEADQQKLTAVSEEMTKCMTKVLTDAATSGAAAMGSAGSAAAAGSGSDAGSGSISQTLEVMRACDFGARFSQMRGD